MLTACKWQVAYLSKAQKRLLGNKRPFVLTRAAYAGTQRYSAVWTGDNSAYDAHMLLWLQRMVNSLGITGMSLVGVDIGGCTGDPHSPRVDGALELAWRLYTHVPQPCRKRAPYTANRGAGARKMRPSLKKTLNNVIVCCLTFTQVITSRTKPAYRLSRTLWR